MYHRIFQPRRHAFSFLHTLLRPQPRNPKQFSPFSSFHSSRNTLASGSHLDLALKEFEQLQSLRLVEESEEESQSQSRSPQSICSSDGSKIEISHPWPEWVELMERLLKNGYFAGSGVISGLGSKDSNRIRTACLNFSRDRSDLVRYFSRKDIQVIVGSGCPSLDRKVVNSGKRLRAHVGIDEGNVCSSCNLRGNCERAYVKAREDEGGRTVDVMRILLTYGLDPITGLVENKQCLNKTVKESVRRLLSEMVELSVRELNLGPQKAMTKKLPFKAGQSSQQGMLKRQIDIPMKQGDWICPKCNFINFARNIKCLRCDGVSQERLRKLGEDQDHLPMKKGDWLCDKCNFLNFAKNTRCLQCKEKPPKRQLNPGEWECDSCNYINFRRNMVCLKCDWKRPKSLNCTDTAARLKHDDQDSRPDSRMIFVRTDDKSHNRRFLRPESQNRDEDSDFWSCGEDGTDDNDTGQHGNFLEFEDFPIAGGKSVVSQDPHEREKWKGEMSTRCKGVSRVREREGDDLGPTTFRRRFDFDECSNGDEMDGWFGYEKKNR
ncbi:zinc finger protein VAR3, chloroplastic-like [Magnolia sinica]|uniref:zinc finger protein VAR3, chloroplastic-like n=1 Tax=Magnolia sinica TaxID=86752 RepID=UPI00265AD309|nr:zinc finger protein VAR3, chloroplastic-like [Magnolia sinica]